MAAQKRNPEAGKSRSFVTTARGGNRAALDPKKGKTIMISPLPSAAKDYKHARDTDKILRGGMKVIDELRMSEILNIPNNTAGEAALIQDLERNDSAQLLDRTSESLIFEAPVDPNVQLGASLPQNQQESRDDSTGYQKKPVNIQL